MKKTNIRTAEWVKIGHPDRLCDLISDAIVDAYITEDPTAKVAVDVFACHGVITVGGEVTSRARPNIVEIVKETYKMIGYNPDEIGVMVNIERQSPEITVKVTEGAGDSGIVTGYACQETEEMLPLETALAKRTAMVLDDMVGFLKPDGKVQVTLRGDTIETIVIAFQVDPKKESRAKRAIKKEVGKELKPYLSKKTEWKLIPFYLGGIAADSGMTGRKNAMWYGPRIPIGGGCFAGKDPTKVDRSGAYLARKIAVAAVQHFGCPEAFVEIAYVIGEDEALYIRLNDEIVMSREVEEDFIRRPLFGVKEIIEGMELRRPIYFKASLLGHFGTGIFPWDKIN